MHLEQLKLPQVDVNGGVSTGNLAPLDLAFKNQTLQSLNNALFPLLFSLVTDTSGVSFMLKGSADIVARTAIGDVPIDAIPFNVTTSLKGMNSFGHTASLSNVTIIGGGSDSHGTFIKSPLTTTLNNPSNISLQTVDVELPVYYKNVMLGRAVIDPLNLVPGDNDLSTEFHYAPNDANDTTAQAFLTEFLQTSDTIPLSIKGDGSSSPFASLVPALEGAQISTNLKGLNVPAFLTHINAYITLDTLITNMITIDFDIANPLDTDMEITFLQVDSGVNGETYAHFDQAFENFVIPAHSTRNSGTVKNVLLTKGALASLAIIPLGKLDVFNAATVKMGPYTIPWLHLTTLDVKTDYQLSLSISAAQGAAQSVSASSAGHSSSTSSSASGSASVSASAASVGLTSGSARPSDTATRPSSPSSSTESSHSTTDAASSQSPPTSSRASQSSASSTDTPKSSTPA